MRLRRVDGNKKSRSGRFGFFSVLGGYSVANPGPSLLYCLGFHVIHPCERLRITDPSEFTLFRFNG